MMPSSSRRARSLVKRSQETRDPKNRFIDLALRLKIKDGPRAGELLRGYGGRWDKKINNGQGAYVGWWDPKLKNWVGDKPKKIKVIMVSEQQAAYIMDFSHKTILALGGRRSGKSAALAIKCLILALTFAGLPGGVLSPTYDQAENVRSHIRRVTPRGWLKPGRFGVKVVQHKLILVNHASIKLVSADRNDSSRSFGFAWYALDERQDIDDEAAANARFSTSEGQGYYSIFETATIKENLREYHDKLLADPKSFL
jgi:hypothetical protein